MKHYIKYILIVTLCMSVTDMRADSLTVVHEDYAAAAAAAKAEDKLLLIDFYTTWCGPCKVLSKQLLDNEQYSDAIGQHFVLLKYDAEKDTVFHLSKKYHINSYPTGIVLNSDGRLLAKKKGMAAAAGNVDILNYMSFLNEAVEKHKSGEYIAGVSTEIDLDYPEFYARYINRTAKYNKEAHEQYWATLSKNDYTKEVPFCILSYFGAVEPVEDYFITHLDEYKQLYGEDDVRGICYGIISRDFRDAVKEKDETRLEAAKQKAVLYLNKEEADFVNNYYTQALWKEKGEWNKIVAYAEGNRQEFIKSEKMNEICWNIFEECEDMVVLKKATVLMKEQTEASPKWHILDTYANLLYKTGDKKNAIAQMERAIQAGRAADEDVSESEKALERFKGSL